MTKRRSSANASHAPKPKPKPGQPWWKTAQAKTASIIAAITTLLLALAAFLGAFNSFIKEILPAIVPTPIATAMVLSCDDYFDGFQIGPPSIPIGSIDTPLNLTADPADPDYLHAGFWLDKYPTHIGGIKLRIHKTTREISILSAIDHSCREIKDVAEELTLPDGTKQLDMSLDGKLYKLQLRFDGDAHILVNFH